MSIQQRFKSIVLACLLTPAFPLVFCEVFLRNGSPTVKLNTNAFFAGSIELSREGRSFSSFLGIPYAYIPQRFEESQIATPSWTGIKSFTESGPACMQHYFGRGPQGAEDCLNVNVYVPMKNVSTSESGMPVMVWIHGGGFVRGRGFGYGPKFFMDENVILLTFNYRLGVFGFLSTGDAVVPGNNALKDMIILLKWVQQHIAQFGGNPKKVTIFGESAGSIAVNYLVLTPLTEGLFDRAIGQSGSGIMLAGTDPNPRSNAVQLATYLNCSTTAKNPFDITSTEILACLRNIPVDTLNQAQFEYKQV